MELDETRMSGQDYSTKILALDYEPPHEGDPGLRRLPDEFLPRVHEPTGGEDGPLLRGRLPLYQLQIPLHRLVRHPRIHRHRRESRPLLPGLPEV